MRVGAPQLPVDRVPVGGRAQIEAAFEAVTQPFEQAGLRFAGSSQRGYDGFDRVGVDGAAGDEA